MNRTPDTERPISAAIFAHAIPAIAISRILASRWTRFTAKADSPTDDPMIRLTVSWETPYLCAAPRSPNEAAADATAGI
jgi:hypothetical protein